LGTSLSVARVADLFFVIKDHIFIKNLYKFKSCGAKNSFLRISWQIGLERFE